MDHVRSSSQQDNTENLLLVVCCAYVYVLISSMHIFWESDGFFSENNIIIQELKNRVTGEKNIIYQGLL